MGHSYSLPRQRPFRVVSPAFSLAKGFLAGTRLPLGSFPSDFKIRKICQQENDVKPDSHDRNRLELHKRWPFYS
jgi:hypothetical protein